MSSKKDVAADLRRYSRNLTAAIQRETSITPSLLRAAADLLDPQEDWPYHGTCVDCPRDARGLAPRPAECVNRDRADHRLR